MEIRKKTPDFKRAEDHILRQYRMRKKRHQRLTDTKAEVSANSAESLSGRLTGVM